MQVLKFGGTSVANAQNMQRVVDIVTKALETDRTILVCSAISKCTDTLIKIGHLAAARDEQYLELLNELQQRHHSIIEELIPQENQQITRTINELFASLRLITQGVYLLGELSTASLDAIQSYGELMSTKIIAAKFSSLAVSCKWVDSRKIVLTTPDEGSQFSKNTVDMEATSRNLLEVVEQDTLTNLFVFPGFISADKHGRTTTLGRGGSDYTASLFAAITKARGLEIWTDVSGMMTSNPKIVPTARPIPHISYRAALELSHFGAKVIYPPTIQPVVAVGIPILVKNTFAPNDYGTLIEQNPPKSTQSIVGISNSDNIALISLEGSGMVGVPGFSSRLFAALSQQNINIILITQASSVHTMCVAISEKDAQKAKRVADECFAYEISLGKLNPLKVETGFSIVCLVGDDMLSLSGATGRMLTALGSHGIRERATAQGSSERNISVIVASEDVENAMRHIHNEFFDKAPEKIINVFLAGYSNVGRTLVQQIHNGAAAIARRTGKMVRVCGVSNSRRFVIDSEGLPLEQIDSLLENGESAANNAYFEALDRLSVKHCVFVDCTANADVANRYVDLLRRGYNVVGCNKIPFASSLTLYNAIVSAARKKSRTLRYETTVGSALPVLESLKRAIISNDRIEQVDALLSGTLGYIFSSYKGVEGESLATIVRRAQELGYTEPDPRLDLSGRDVMRKLIIIGREAGVPLEEAQIEQHPLLSEDYFEGSVEDFYALLEKKEAHFQQLYADAKQQGGRLRMLAQLTISGEQYKASFGLTTVPENSPFYNLDGADNCVVMRSKYYPSPLVIRGAGAGANQTASGVLNDILL